MSAKNLFAGMLCLLPVAASAQQEDSIPVVEVLSSVQRQAVVSSVPMQLLGRNEILKLGVADISDALRRLPGITLRDYGGAGGMKTVSVRGLGAQHTGVCYDGILLSDCQSGEIDVARYSLENVDALRLIIGDNDDIFTTAKNAGYASILDINTLRIPDADIHPHATLQMKLGSFGYACPYLRFEQNISENFGISAMGEYTYAENNYPYTIENGNTHTSDYRKNSRMNSGHGELNFIWNANRQQLNGKLYYYDNDRLLPGIVRYYTNDNKEKLHDKNAFAQLGYTVSPFHDFAIRWKGKFNWAESVYVDGNYADGINDANYWQREYYTSLAFLYTMKSFAFDYSADYSYNNFNSSKNVYGRPYRRTILQTLTAKYAAPRITIMARLLHSLYFNYNDSGNKAENLRKLSPSVSISYRLLPEHDLYIRASYKNIFRSPNFNESYYFHYGSTDLKPEIADQYNVGVTYRRLTSMGAWQFTLDGYLNHVKDKIVAVPYNMFIWTNINVGRVIATGFDFSGKVSRKIAKGHEILTSMSYSFMRAENRTNRESDYYGYQIAYTPEHSGSLAVGWQNPWANVSINADGQSSRWATNNHYQSTDIDGYIELGASVYRQFRIKKGLMELRLYGKNLLNKQYEIVAHYPMPGISYMLSVKYKF